MKGVNKDEENDVVERSSVKVRKNMENLVEDASKNNDVGQNMNQEKQA